MIALLQELIETSLHRFIRRIQKLNQLRKVKCFHKFLKKQIEEQ